MKTQTRGAKVILTALLAFSSVAQLSEAAKIRAVLQTPASRKAAPAFRLTDANGKPVRDTDYRGKVVVLNFWATECGGCRIEIPWFVDLDSSLKNTNAVVVGISMDLSYESLKNEAEGWAKVKPFVRTSGIAYPILLANEQATKEFAINALPLTYLIDRNGRIAATYAGLIDEEDVKANVKALLAEH